MAEKQALLLGDPATRALLKDIARRLRPYKDELVEQWTNAYRSSVGKPSGMAEDGLTFLGQRLVRQFIEEVRLGHFDAFVDLAQATGKSSAEQGIPYGTLPLAISLFESTCLPFLHEEYPDCADYAKALTAVHQLDLNLLSILSASYWEAKQERLRRCQEEAAEARRRRDQLIATVVHDFRGPLTSIMGFSQLTERALTKGKPAELRQVEIVSREAKHLDKMLDDLADMSQIEAGRLELERKPTDVVALTRSVLDEMPASADIHRLHLDAPGQPVVGNWDSERLAQALRYLLDHAIKLSPEEGEIRIAIEPEDGRVTATITYPGDFIPEEFREQVLQPLSQYYRERRIKGMGIGLFIAKGIVEGHGGRLQVESETGKGNRFILVLPR